MGWLKYLQMIVAILPTIIDVIKKIEEIIGGGNGAAKKDLVVSLVTAAVPEENKAEINPVLGNVVDKVVGTFNALGIFKHSAA